MKIYVCSPYGGKEENYFAAMEYCREVAAAGHIPFASHVMLHGVLKEPEGRKMGLEAGLAMVDICEELWVFGLNVSSGMAAEIARAEDRGIPVQFIQIRGGKLCAIS